MRLVKGTRTKLRMKNSQTRKTKKRMTKKSQRRRLTSRKTSETRCLVKREGPARTKLIDRNLKTERVEIENLETKTDAANQERRSQGIRRKEGPEAERKIRRLSQSLKTSTMSEREAKAVLLGVVHRVQTKRRSWNFSKLLQERYLRRGKMCLTIK